MPETTLSNILNVPMPTKEVGQRSISVQDAYLTRFIPTWTSRSGLTPEMWRYWVLSQGVATTCKETLISTLISLDWKITPRDSEMRDELKATMRYYTKLLEHGGNWYDLDWTGFLEWTLADLMDLPFGTAVEVGRKGDAPEGRVMWIKPLDAGTLYPTLNKYFPIMQFYANATEAVYFPEHAINRMYLSPRPELLQEGWGMAPPEKVYLAMEMLSRGDRYYAGLLLDVPPAGILDLGDMDKDSALEWVESFRTFVAGGGVDGFKIPVLYEHTTKPSFIPFGKVPNDIMYSEITLKYAAIVAAAYGMSLSDIGLSGNGTGETLAGSIRSERKTRRTGLAKLKKKLKFFVEKFLPDSLQFDFIDMDDELATALGRARLANATAWGQLIDKGMFSREEGRLQTIQDGLITISVPEAPPPMPVVQGRQGNGGNPTERPGMLGNPQAPSQGGDGEVKKMLGLTVEKGKSFNSHINKLVKRICEDVAPVLTLSLQNVNIDDLYLLRSAVDESLYGVEDVFGIGEVLKAIWVKDNWVTLKDTDIAFELKSMFTVKYVWDFTDEQIEKIDFAPYAEELKHRVSSEIKNFIGKSIVSMLKNEILVEGVFDSPAQRYDNLVDVIRKTIVDNFDEFSSTCIGLEADKILNEIRESEVING